MRFRGFAPLLCCVTLWLGAEAGEFNDKDRLWILQHAPLGEPPADPTNAVADDRRAAALGRRLFFEPRLSGDGTRSCASCHDPNRDWSDGKILSDGAAPGRRHTPSLWNVAFARWFFWDGRADSLWSQALQPIESDAELAGDRLSVYRLIGQDSMLRDEYVAIFADYPEVTERPHFSQLTSTDQLKVNRVFSNLGKAIAAFERTIVTSDSRFDRFVADLRSGTTAESNALNAEEKAGLRIFVGKGQCRFCHVGPEFSDSEFHNLELPTRKGAALDLGRQQGIAELLEDPFHSRGVYSDDTEGRAALLKHAGYVSSIPGPDSGRALALVESEEQTRGAFRTPTLRNVARTAPYMHDGRFSTLREVIDYYTQLEADFVAGPYRHAVHFPLELSDTEIAALVAFLGTLSSSESPQESFGSD